MADIFISYNHKDHQIAQQLSENLEKEGFTCWYYEKDSEAFAKQLEEESNTIQNCKAAIVIVSPHSLNSEEVNDELNLIRAFRKPILPVLSRISYEELKQEKPEWLLVFRDTVAIPLPAQGVVAIIGRITDGLKKRGIQPQEKRLSAQNIICVMGTKGGVGKSSVIAAMAELIASTGHSVLIIDADIDSAGITKLLSPRTQEKPRVLSVLEAAYNAAGKTKLNQNTDYTAWDVTPKYLHDERFGKIFLIPGRHDSDLRPGYEAMADISPEKRNQAAITILRDTIRRKEQLPAKIDCILIDSGAENNPLVSAGFVISSYGFIVCSPRADSFTDVSRLQSMHEQRYSHTENTVVPMKVIVNQAVPETETLWSGITNVNFIREDPSMRLASALAGEFDFQGIGLNWFYIDVLKALKNNVKSEFNSKFLPDETEVWVKPYLKNLKDLPEIILRKPSFRFMGLFTALIVLLVMAFIGAGIITSMTFNDKVNEGVTTREIIKPDAVTDTEFNQMVAKIKFPAEFEDRIWIENNTLSIKGKISQTELTELKTAMGYIPVQDALLEGAALGEKSVKDAVQTASSVKSASFVIGGLGIVLIGIRIAQHLKLSKRKKLVQNLVKARGVTSEKELTKFIQELIEKEPAKPQLRWLREEFHQYEAKRIGRTISDLFQ